MYFIPAPNAPEALEAFQEGEWYLSKTAAEAVADQLSSYGVEEYRVFSLTIQEVQ